MSLVKCPECGRENVSDTAIACPNCGFNLKEYYENKKFSLEEDTKDSDTKNLTNNILDKDYNITKEKSINKVILAIVTGIVIVLFLVITTIFSASPEAKEVSKAIDEIGEVTSESGNKIYNARQKYNALDPKDQKSVKNINVLDKAEAEFEAYIPEYLEKKVNDYYYEIALANIEDIQIFVNNYYDYFTEEERNHMRCVVGGLKAKELVSDYIQSTLKNPSSYELVSFEPGVFTGGENGEVSSLISITFRGTNSFGGVVTDSKSGLVTLDVNLRSCTAAIKSSLSFF